MFFFIALWVFLQVWEIQGVWRVWRMLDFFQGLRGENLLADTIIWFLCDGLLGYGCYVYRNTSGKTLVAVIRFLQKYLERVWWVCLCYTQMEEGTFFLFSLLLITKPQVAKRSSRRRKVIQEISSKAQSMSSNNWNSFWLAFYS